MAVIAQRERLRQIAGQRGKAAEMRDPLRIAQPVEADLGRGAIVAQAQPRFGEIRRADSIAQPVRQRRDTRIGMIAVRHVQRRRGGDGVIHARTCASLAPHAQALRDA